MMATVKDQVDAVAEKQDAVVEAAAEAAAATTEAESEAEVEEASGDEVDKSSNDGEGSPSNTPKF